MYNIQWICLPYNQTTCTAAGNTFKTTLVIVNLETTIAMIEMDKIDRCNNNCDYSHIASIVNIDMIATRNMSFDNYNGLKYFAYYFKNSINDMKDQQYLKVFVSWFRRLFKQQRMNSDNDSKDIVVVI